MPTLDGYQTHMPRPLMLTRYLVQEAWAKTVET